MYRIQLKMHGGKWQTAMMFEDADSLRRAYRSFVIIMGGWCVRIQKQVGPKWMEARTQEVQSLNRKRKDVIALIESVAASGKEQYTGLDVSTQP